MTSNTQTRPTPLSDAQREVLAAAAQRPQGAVIMPARLKGKAASRTAEALLGKALVREIRAKGELPVWRADETGKRYGLVLTRAGRALVAEPTKDARTEEPAPVLILSASASTTEAEARPAPRSGSKLAAVIALLRRDTGSSVPELMAATGWLPHTARAALTGLRKRGYGVTREAAEGGSGSVYRIASTPEAAAA